METKKRSFEHAQQPHIWEVAHTFLLSTASPTEWTELQTPTYKGRESVFCITFPIPEHGFILTDTFYLCFPQEISKLNLLIIHPRKENPLSKGRGAIIHR